MLPFAQRLHDSEDRARADYARIFDSYNCEGCGEKTGANWIRIAGGKKLCLDCYESYNRFDV